MGNLLSLKTNPEKSKEDQAFVLGKFKELLDVDDVQGFVISIYREGVVNVMATGLSGIECTGLLMESIAVLDYLEPMTDEDPPPPS